LRKEYPYLTTIEAYEDMLKTSAKKQKK